MVVNEVRRRVEFSECDAAKIVFYPTYFRWFDEATWHLFAKVGFPPAVLYAEYRFAGMPILEVKSKFIGPSRFFEEVVVESHVAEWRDKTFDVVHRVLNNGTVTAEGTETRIWCEWHPDDPKRLKARSVPQPIVAALSA
jgi:4-hydroxybenzoyl-CoA thioesterase